MEPADAVLLERWVGRRDAEAFQALVRRYSALVFSACRRVLGDASRAEDVTQECFLKLATGDARPGPFLGPWLHKMATRRCLDALRSERRRQAREARYVAEAPQSVEARWETLEPLIDEALAELPERFRVPISLHFLEGLSHEEVAQRLGTPRTTVGYRISRGLERLGTRLRSRGVNVASGVLVARLGEMPLETPSAELAATLSKMALARTARALPHVHWLKTALASYGTGALVAVVMGVAGFAGVSHLLAPRDEAPSPTVTLQGTQAAADASKRVQRTARSVHEIGSVPSGLPTQPAADGASAASPTPSETSSTGGDPEPGAIAGSVVDEDYQPIPDAEVRVLLEESLTRLEAGVKSFSTSTDAKGLFQLMGLPSEQALVLAVNAAGFGCPYMPSLQLKPGETLADRCIVLTKGITLYGRVIGRDGNPVPDALVVSRYVRGPSRTGGSNASALTDGKGLFQLGFREEATAVLHVLTYRWGEAIFTAEVQPDAFVELRMPAPATVTGRVTRADGRPVAEVNVVLSATSEEANGTVAHYTALTDVDGRYEKTPLPPDVEYVAAVQDSSSRALSNRQSLGVLAAGATKNFDIRLEKPALLRGSITGERTGRPQKGARVAWVREHDSNDDAATAGDDGTYELELFEPGSYWVYAVPVPGDLNNDCRQKYGRAVSVTLDSEQTADFRLPDAFSLGVHVVDGQGRGIGEAKIGAAMLLGPDSELSWGLRRTDAEGRYRYHGFLPGYEGWLSVQSPEPAAVMGASYAGNGARRAYTTHIQGEPGVDYPEETVVLYGASGVKGVAMTADGRPFANCRLDIRMSSPGLVIDGTRSGEISANASVKTDAIGGFTLVEGVPATSLSMTLMLQAEDGGVYRCDLELVDCLAGEVTDLGGTAFQADPSAETHVVTGQGAFFRSTSE